jgi:hypothetical protein
MAVTAVSAHEARARHSGQPGHDAIDPISATVRGGGDNHVGPIGRPASQVTFPSVAGGVGRGWVPGHDTGQGIDAYITPSVVRTSPVTFASGAATPSAPLSAAAGAAA